MNIREAIAEIYKGNKLTLPEWKGYWYLKDGLIWVHAKTETGWEETETPWIEKYSSREDWEVCGRVIVYPVKIIAESGKTQVIDSTGRLLLTSLNLTLSLIKQLFEGAFNEKKPTRLLKESKIFSSMKNWRIEEGYIIVDMEFKSGIKIFSVEDENLGKELCETLRGLKF